jgi:UDP-glucose 4-epimerase
VVPNFILRALQNEPLEVYGDGEQLLDLIYVKDVAEILMRALLMNHGNYDYTMDAGSGKLVSANQLANLIIDITKSKSKITHLPMRGGEPMRSITRGDIATLNPLDYTAKISLEEGLQITVDWHKKNYKA